MNGNYNSRTSTTITATITGGDGSAVEFTSSNPSVAGIATQNGAKATIIATGKGTGTAKITCKAANGKSASCTIKVVNPPSRLAITSKAGCSNSVAIGKKTKLSSVFEEGFGSVSSKKVTWTSLDPTVATVDKSGNVKGVKNGEATIKAVANDGSGLTAQYVVNVYDPIKNLKLKGFWEGSLILTKFNVNRVYQNVTVLYNGSPYPYGSAESVCPDVAIEVGNPDIVSMVYMGPGYYDLYALKRGQTTITVKALDGSGVKKTYKIIVV